MCGTSVEGRVVTRSAVLRHAVPCLAVHQVRTGLLSAIDVDMLISRTLSEELSDPARWDLRAGSWDLGAAQQHI